MSLSGNLCRKYYLLITYANRAALIQHSTILSRTFQIQYSQKRWSGSCLNKQMRKKKKKPNKTQTQRSTAGEGFQSSYCESRPQAATRWCPWTRALVCLARGLGLCQVQNQEESCLWSHFSCTGPTESSYSDLAATCTWLGHQDVSWSISNHQGFLHRAQGACCCLKTK